MRLFGHNFTRWRLDHSVTDRSHNSAKYNSGANSTLNILKRWNTNRIAFWNQNTKQAFVAANIPFYKLNNPMFWKFLEERMHRKIPDESTIWKNYLYYTPMWILCKKSETILENIQCLFQSTKRRTKKDGEEIRNNFFSLFNCQFNLCGSTLA